MSALIRDFPDEFCVQGKTMPAPRPYVRPTVDGTQTSNAGIASQQRCGNGHITYGAELEDVGRGAGGDNLPQSDVWRLSPPVLSAALLFGQYGDDFAHVTLGNTAFSPMPAKVNGGCHDHS